MQRVPQLKLPQLPYLHGKHIRGRTREKNPRGQRDKEAVRLRLNRGCPEAVRRKPSKDKTDRTDTDPHGKVITKSYRKMQT